MISVKRLKKNADLIKKNVSFVQRLPVLDAMITRLQCIHALTAIPILMETVD